MYILYYYIGTPERYAFILYYLVALPLAQVIRRKIIKITTPSPPPLPPNQISRAFIQYYYYYYYDIRHNEIVYSTSHVALYFINYYNIIHCVPSPMQLTPASGVSAS